MAIYSTPFLGALASVVWKEDGPPALLDELSFLVKCRHVPAEVRGWPCIATKVIVHSDAPPPDVPQSPDRRDGILDAPRLLSNLDGDVGLLGDLIALFRKTSAGYIAAIHAALAKDDLGEILFAAHAMKGAVGGLWGTGTWELMAKIEQASREGDLPTIQALVPTVQPALDALFSRLDELYRFRQG